MASNKYALGETIRKFMGNPNFWAAAPPVTGAAIAVGTAGYNHIQEPKRKAKAYQEMLGANPALKKRHGEKTRAYFNSMYNVSPALAKDPHVSGAWVQNVLDNEDPHDARPNYTLLSAVQDLAGPSKSLMDAKSKAKSNPFAEHAVSALEGTGKALMGHRSDAKHDFEREQDRLRQDAREKRDRAFQLKMRGLGDE